LEAAGHALFLIDLGGQADLGEGVDFLGLSACEPEAIDKALALAGRVTGGFEGALIWFDGEMGRSDVADALAIMAALARLAAQGGAPKSCLIVQNGRAQAGAQDLGAALAGLARTAALELSPIPVTAAFLQESEGALAQVVDLLEARPSGVFVRRDGLWWRRDIEPFGPIAQDAPESLAGDDAQTVIWATGGLRGITAISTLAVAKRARGARVVLIGRGAGAQVPGWAEGVAPGDLQRAALSALGRKTPLRDLRAVVSQAQKAQAEQDTLAAFDAAGIDVHVLHTDLFDAPALARAVETLPERLRKPEIVIHGAGALSDRHLGDKTNADFEIVWQPKVDGFAALMGVLPAAVQAKRILLFASTAGTFGNPGQADYAGANEVLVAQAAELDARKGCAATAIAWGPWSGGMVGDALEAHFKARGIVAIPSARGAELCADIAFGRTGPAIVVDGGMAGEAPFGALDWSLAAEPLLEEHCLNGRPVLPAAWAAASLARHTGSAALCAFEVGAGAPFSGGHARLDMSQDAGRWQLVRDGKIAFSASPGVSHAPQDAFEAEILPPEDAKEIDANGYLNGPLGYGPAFARVRRAWERGDAEIIAEIGPLPAVPGWTGLLNPLLYDVATHTLLIHAWEARGGSVLPRRVERVFWHHPAPLDTPVFARADITENTGEAVTADIRAFGADGRLLLELLGFHAVHRAGEGSGHAAIAARPAARGVEEPVLSEDG
ncbi:MAG: SDR family oxidoreductase, partial [Pseudomonadota bacterium]